MTTITIKTKTEITDILIAARVSMLFNAPFWGQIACRLILEDASEWCPTAATDGRKFYYNAQWISAKTTQELVFLLGHEIGHIMYEHFLRVGDRDKRRWNEAGDYVINSMLIDQKVGQFIQTGLYDKRFDGMTTEQVYDILESEGNEPRETLDVHISVEKGDGDNNDNNESMPMTPSERQSLSDEIKDIVIQAAQAAGSEKVPPQIRKMLQELLEPKMDWPEIIQTSVESSVKNDYSWQKRNRKSFFSGVLLPGMNNDEEIDICIAIDTSGSISTKMLREFVSEIASIMDVFAAYTLRIWQFDTNTYGYKEFTHDDGSDILDYKITGGGGTDFMCNWEFMEDHDIVPDQFIVFTDGMPYGKWGIEEYCDTIFLIHGDTKITAPFGVTAHYDA